MTKLSPGGGARAALLVATVAFGALPVHSQTAARDSLPLSGGARVRITAVEQPTQRRARHVGRVMRHDDSGAVILSRRGRDEPQVIPRASVQLVEVSARRSHGLGALCGAGVGLLAGAVTGGVLGAATLYEGEGCYFVCTRAAGAGLGAVLLGVPGLVIGGAVGAFIPVERWRRVYPDTRVGLGPTGQGGVALTVRFVR